MEFAVTIIQKIYISVFRISPYMRRKAEEIESTNIALSFTRDTQRMQSILRQQMSQYESLKCFDVPQKQMWLLHRTDV